MTLRRLAPKADPNKQIYLTIAVAVALVGAILAGLNLASPKAEVVEASYQVVAGHGALNPGTGEASSRHSYVAANFELVIDSTIRGRRVWIDRVRFLGPDRKTRGVAPVHSFARLLDAEIIAQGVPRKIVKPEVVEPPVRLYPLEGGRFRFGVQTTSDLGFAPGEEVRAVIEGRIGFRRFSTPAPSAKASA